MAAPTPSEGTVTTRRSRAARISWGSYSQGFRLRHRDLFKPFDKVAIREAMIAERIPPTVLEDVLDTMLSLDRRALDEDYTQHSTQTPEEREAARKREADQRAAALEEARILATHRALRRAGPETVMWDGRALGDWSIAEIRRAGGVFGFILAKAGDKDDTRKVRDVMTARDWKKPGGTKRK